MTELLTAAQMRAIEAAAIESGKASGLELMERAGQGVVEAVLAEWPELATGDHRAVVLCGPGNNGGDGFVVARLLAERGWAVDVFLYGDAEKLPPDAKANYQRWCGIGAVSGIDALWDYLPDMNARTIFFDALFGTGLTRPLPADLQTLASHLLFLSDMVPGNETVAIDMPSGVSSDSGQGLGDNQVFAQLTVSFHAKKLGHVLAEGPSRSGKVVVADIGLDAAQGPELASEVTQPTAELGKGRVGHKYSHGHALILSGPAGKGGAARLAARGALRIGAGVVTLGCPHEALGENAAQLNAVMLSEIDDAATLARILDDTRITALALGPGLGFDRARALVPVALAAGRATLLDADALSAFSGDPTTLFAMLHPDCVLTPHAGEFARLFPDIAEKLKAPASGGPAYSKLDATRDAAARAGCVVLYKGPDTVIAARDGRASVHTAAYQRAAPWLATAGSGDVLAGFIAGLMARGFAPSEAAETAAWLHVECALSFGPGLIAEDLPEELPKVFRALGV